MRDQWDGGDAYEHYVGRWSRPVARQFLDWLGVPPGRRWLDVGCGTGALTQTILTVADPAEVLAVDPSESYLGAARATTPDDRARFALASAAELPHDAGDRDAVVSGLVLNFVPDPQAALAGMASGTVQGGTVAAYVWDYADGMELMRRFWDVAAALDARAAELDEGRRFPICHPQRLAALFTGAGLVDVRTTAIDIATPFVDFDDYWQPFLGGQGPAPSYAASLSPDALAALRQQLQAILPVADDGSISLRARAWAVRGHRP